MKKRIISLVMCVVLVMCMMPNTAYAEEPQKVTAVEVTVKEPEAGKAFPTTVTLTGAGYETKDVADCEDDVNGIRWFDLTNSCNMKTTDKFVLGNKYRLFLNLVPKTGYELELSTATIKKSDATSVTTKIVSKSENSAEIYADFICGGTLSKVEITRISPKVGSTPDFAMIKGDGFATEEIQWRDETTNTEMVLGSSLKFVCKHRYSVTMKLKTTDEVKWNTTVTATVNDKEAVVTRTDDSNITLKYTFAETGHYDQTEIKNGKPATFKEAGMSGDKYCKMCGEKVDSTKEVPAIGDNFVLSYVKKTYTGADIAPPVLTIKDSKGSELKNGIDYTVTGLNKNKNVGLYKVAITFKGNYTGTKDLYYSIVPKAPATVKATLSTSSGGYDDVVFSWSKSVGATGYRIYYKKSTDKKYTLMGNTGKTSVVKKNLADGAKYTFRVIPCYKGSDSKLYYNAYRDVNIYTLKKVPKIALGKSGSKVKVKWTNVEGETGYQISKSTTKKGTKVVSTYKTTKGTYKTLTATKGKTYYYKVRAYSVVNGKKVYAPWSAVKSYKRK